MVAIIWLKKEIMIMIIVEVNVNCRYLTKTDLRNKTPNYLLLKFLVIRLLTWGHFCPFCIGSNKCSELPNVVITALKCFSVKLYYFALQLVLHLISCYLILSFMYHCNQNCTMATAPLLHYGQYHCLYHWKYHGKTKSTMHYHHNTMVRFCEGSGLRHLLAITDKTKSN